MNGRCETDPFDRAVDICRICYGEFCWTCLVETKGRDQPMCRECALIVGGLRPRAKPRIRGSKKTMKARREALREAREAPRHHGANFTFFDAGDDHSFVGFQDSGSSPTRQQPEPTPDVSPPQEVRDSPAVRRLDSIRRADRQTSPDVDQFAESPPPTPAAATPPPPPPGQTPAPATADEVPFTLETYTPEPLDQDPSAPGSTADQIAPAAYQPTPGFSGAAPIGHEPPPPAALPDDTFEEEVPVGYAPPPWETLAAPSDLAQMDTVPDDSTDARSATSNNPSDANNSDDSPGEGDTGDDSFNFDEPAEFRKPRPFVTAAKPAAAEAAPPVPVAAAATPAAVATPQSPAPTDHAEWTEPAVPAAATAPPTQAQAQADSPPPIDGQPSATPPAEYAIAAVGRAEPDEPVHIHDDPWARTGPEVVSTAPLPRRRPDPKPSEDSSSSPPDWTKAKLPKFD